MTQYDTYENPLITRYATREMTEIFSDRQRIRIWRRLWIALAEAEKELGLDITDEQIEQLKQYKDDINFDVSSAREKEVRHDVMAHVYAYGVQCPKAKGIIHLGATSCFVGDNADIITMDKALHIIRRKLLNCMSLLSKFAQDHKDLPTLGFTHYQPAQLTTVGKRACLWLQDLLMDYRELENLVNTQIMLRGLKGTTGTQASFMTLFEEDEEKVTELEKRVVAKMGYEKSFPVTGQTYPRKLDHLVLGVLSNIAQSAYKFANDIRLLQNLKEIEEPFEKSQIGSSAMAYKRNPMRSERVCSLSRYVISLSMNTAITASTQWFERTLDDSANKRLVIPQAFLAVDGILNLLMNVTDGMVVYRQMIQKHVMEELPFMATETILMEAVKRGGDRQELHERIREHSMWAAEQVKYFGNANYLLTRIAEDPHFPLNSEEIQEIISPSRFTGRSSSQVTEFIEQYIQPILDEHKKELGLTGVVNV